MPQQPTHRRSGQQLSPWLELRSPSAQSARAGPASRQPVRQLFDPSPSGVSGRLANNMSASPVSDCSTSRVWATSNPLPLASALGPRRLGHVTPAGIQLNMDDQFHPMAVSETGRIEAFSDGVLA